MIARFVTLLPEPDSPTTPSVSPRESVNEQVGDGLDDAVARREANGQVAHVEETAVESLASRVAHSRVEERVDDVDHEVHDRDRDGGDEHDAERPSADPA